MSFKNIAFIKHYRNKFFGVWVLLALFMAGLVFHSQASFAKGNPKYASLVMEANTGRIISQRYADKVLHPASLTKVMTLYLAFDALEDGRLRLNQRIPISKRAEKMVPSKLGLKRGETIRVRDAIYALVTKSANDVAVALAESIGGTEYGFAKMMTAKARDLGMTKTRFMNASGLHHRHQVSTARDMAKLARAVLLNHPKHYHYFSKQQFSYGGKTYRNHNRLLGKYGGMDGMKTGYIAASGFNLVASAKRDGRRIIGVVFGGRTSKTRNRHMRKLLDRAFNRLPDMQIARGPIPVPTRKPTTTYAMAAAEPLENTATQKKLEALYANLRPEQSRTMLSEVFGEGDIDPEQTARIETGLMTSAMHHDRQNKEVQYIQAAYFDGLSKFGKKAKKQAGNWAIQVGAFSSRAATERAIGMAQDNLPASLKNNKPSIVPLQTRRGTLFRGRLTGYSRSAALQACQALKDCMPIAPLAAN